MSACARALVAVAAVAAVAGGQNVAVIDNNSARCVNKVPAYTASDNTALATKNAISIGGVSEKQCVHMCTDNMDVRGTPLVCASATYDFIGATCHIHPVKAMPDGPMPTKAVNGSRYYEKFCLPATAPIACGEALFIRREQMILIGAATNVSRETTLEGCVRQCLGESFDCRSALFFWEDNECITNRKAAFELQPSAFVEEFADQVVYFENACMDDLPKLVMSDDNALVLDTPTGATAATGSVVSLGTVRDARTTPRPRRVPTTTRAPTTTTTTTTTAVTTTNDPLYNHRIGHTFWSAWTSCDRPDGRRVRRRQCTLPQFCGAPLLQSQLCAEIDAVFLTTTTQSTTLPPTTAVPTTAVPTTTTTTARPTSLSSVPVDQRGWGPWRPGCRQFVQRRPCDAGEEVGFQTRSCLGHPAQCQGSVFRYCTLPC